MPLHTPQGTLYSRMLLHFAFLLFLNLQLITGVPTSSNLAGIYIIHFYNDVSEAAKQSYADSLKEEISTKNVDILRVPDEMLCIIARLTPDQAKSWDTDIVSPGRTPRALVLTNSLFSCRSKKLI
jgi:hypothetical protein